MTTRPTEPEQTPPEAQTFEESLARLEAIVAQLEKGNTGLDEAVRAYEEGVVLARRCRDRIEKAELRIQQLAVRDDDERGTEDVESGPGGSASVGTNPEPDAPPNEAGDLFGT